MKPGRAFPFFLALVLFGMVLFRTTPVWAGSVTLRIGPAAVGGGGPNPVGIPPGPTDVELGYVSKSMYETNIAASPGLLFGKRWLGAQGFYLSGGGGIIVSRNGVGLGGYSAFGGDFGQGTLRFNAEFKQAIGFSSRVLISPYALRVGFSYFF